MTFEWRFWTKEGSKNVENVTFVFQSCGDFSFAQLFLKTVRDLTDLQGKI